MDITKIIKSIVILDSDGKRTLAKVFDENAGTRQFETKLFKKTKLQRIRDEIVIMDGMLIVHRFITNIHIYVVGDRNENPLILDAVLNCLVEVIQSLLNKTVEQSTLEIRMSHVILALDEICDNGVVLETDSNLVLQRVNLKDDIVEQSMAQRFQSATENIKFPWIRS